ncbi:MAG: hypothetical protein QXM96_03400, partial [Candidatus Woesearchaeota archaeon]
EKKSVNMGRYFLYLATGSLISNIANYLFNYYNPDFVSGVLTTLIGVCFLLGSFYLNRKPDFVEPVFSGNQKNALQYLKSLYEKKGQ